MFRYSKDLHRKPTMLYTDLDTVSEHKELSTFWTSRKLWQESNWLVMGSPLGWDRTTHNHRNIGCNCPHQPPFRPQAHTKCHSVSLLPSRQVDERDMLACSPFSHLTGLLRYALCIITFSGTQKAINNNTTNTYTPLPQLKNSKCAGWEKYCLAIAMRT